MADEAPETLPNGEDNTPAVGLIAQYIKDMSFENPNSPAVYQWTGQPQVDVQFNIGATPAGDDVHEVTLKILVKSSAADKVAYQVELDYAGLFGFRNIPDDQVTPFLLAEAPRLLFPFARRVVADAVRDGGFAPMLLEPIDFHALYLQQAEAQAAEGEGVAGNA
jgi:preprotein translocase subunit SecB